LITTTTRQYRVQEYHEVIQEFIEIYRDIWDFRFSNGGRLW
jgi:hypothetical protein